MPLTLTPKVDFKRSYYFMYQPERKILLIKQWYDVFCYIEFYPMETEQVLLDVLTQIFIIYYSCTYV